MDDFVRNLFDQKSTHLKCDVLETKEDYVFEFDVPGIAKDDISINIDNHDLTVEANRHKATEEGVKLRNERAWGSFKRTFQLPYQISDTTKVSATHQDGVLKVTVPKTSAKLHRVAIA